jgi:putative multiple sugar transport system substrate-binding protein
MKKRIAVILLGMVVTGTCFSGCGKNDATEAAKESQATEKEGNGETIDETQDEASEEDTEPALKVGVLLPSADTDERWTQDAQTMQEDLEEAGYEALVYYADEDSSKQISQIEELLEQEVSALIIAPYDPYGLDEVLAQAKENSIPVFSYDSLIMNTDAVSYYVTFDTRKAGQQIGQAIVKANDLEKARENKETRNIEFLMGEPDDSQELFLYNGIMEVLQSYLDDGTLVNPSGRLSFDDTTIMRKSQSTAKTVMKSILDEYYQDANQNLDILCTAYDGFALGAVEVLEQEGLLASDEAWPYITSVGCDTEAVKKVITGELAFSVFWDNRALAEECVKMVDTYLTGETPDVTDYEQYDNGKKIIGTRTCDAEIIDKDNYQILVDNGYYTEEDIAVELPEEETESESETDEAVSGEENETESETDSENDQTTEESKTLL